MQRRAILITGVVQGVGFRPFVQAVAVRWGLGGFVRNLGGRVEIEVEGQTEDIDRFFEEVTSRPPPLARIFAANAASIAPLGEKQFRIEPSEAGDTGFVPPDSATCADCLSELFDPSDRRFRYPFQSCTNCGPRLTIADGFPFDRERTTMATFPLCSECRREYEDPVDRRFHAQAMACPKCGPRMSLLDARGCAVPTADPIGHVVAALRTGRIVAVKGLGGYHLACDAANAAAVSELRRRKHRDEKPFAVMVADISAALELAEVSEAEAGILLSPRRPIVLLRRRADIRLAEQVAPGCPLVGLMLPYTPLHHLLMRDLVGTPLVMTSGNRSDEPISYDDADAVSRLTGIADLFLIHDRMIRTRCDDSVTRVVAGFELPVRRSRGDAPRPVPLLRRCPQPTLALGGQLKTVFACGRDDQALLSHHVGDLDQYEAYRSYVEAIRHYQKLFRFRPTIVVHDLHPDYASTRYALERQEAEPDLTRLSVQHHHAHLAACMAEHHLEGNVLGVVFDGSGYGPDGAIWGGEFLIGGYSSFRRAGHLRNVRLPGGDAAIREPWRIALSHLKDAGEGPELLADRVPESSLRACEGLIECRLNAPFTSSAGRLFDAVACLGGLRDRVSYEAQAAAEFEWLAHGDVSDDPYPFTLSPPGECPIEVDTRPLVAAVALDIRRGAPGRQISQRFHSSVVEFITAVCQRLRAETGLDRVALSGGVFLNALLLTSTVERLTAEGYRVYRHSQVPPGDGGLCLGQLMIAAARFC